MATTTTLSFEPKFIERELKLRGVKLTSEKIAVKANSLIPSKRFAIAYALEELDAASHAEGTVLDYVHKSGFTKEIYQEYSNHPNYEETFKTVNDIQEFINSYLMYVKNAAMRTKVSISILDFIMHLWQIGKYSQNGFVLDEDSTLFK